MSDIDKTLEAFVSVCKKYDIPGRFETIDDLSKVFPVKLPFPADMDYFYKKFNPEDLLIETGITPITLYSAKDLEKAQVGYSSFPDNYLVIGDDIGGGKPIIAVVDREHTPIYANYDVGKPFKIADSFTDFILSLTKLIELVYGQYDIFDVIDEDDESHEIKESFISELRAHISPIIGNENFEAFWDYFYG